MVIEAPEWKVPVMEIGDKKVVRRILHWGTGFAYFVISYIGAVSTFFALQLVPIDNSKGIIHLSVFLLWNFLTMINLFNASFLGPGYVPKRWKPENKSHAQKLQYCTPCQGYKVPRSHHCSKCNRCCMKMDHHCPWINNCVGHRNHFYFIRFLFFAIVGCIHALIINSYSIYYGIFAGWYARYGNGTEPEIFLTPASFIAIIFAFALSAAVSIALTILLVTQIRYVLKNMTGIEEYIDGKAKALRKSEERARTESESEEDEEFEKSPEWIYPYNIGWKRNLKEVMSNVFSGKTVGNGTWWPVRDGTNQFTLTMEQLYQKQIKKDRSRAVRIAEDFDGKCCSARKYGWKVFFKQPIIDGKMLKINAGDILIATRGNGGWAYGFKETNPLVKGWIPLGCAEKYLQSKDDKKMD